MDAGVDAVRSMIVSEFNPGSVTEHVDNSHTSTDLGFLADGRNFVVRVSMEYDHDYGPHLAVDLDQLSPILRASKDGKATVKMIGIESGISA